MNIIFVICIILTVSVLICYFAIDRRNLLKKVRESGQLSEKLRSELSMTLETVGALQLKDIESGVVSERLKADQEKIEEEKRKIEEKNKKIWKMSEAALKEKHRLEEMNTELQNEKTSMEAEKKKLDEKIKKLWQTSLSIHKEKERVSELNSLLETEKEKTERLFTELQLKNREITDNIDYARRIQSAILPDIEDIYNTLPQSFVYYQPKDIVSGDFYSFAKKKNRVLFIAGDCTGHGVSGAFMSMIASSLLNQIINERGIVEPAIILNQLNSLVIETLRQKENESNDGLDVSICTICTDKNELQYAGANRPLWLLRHEAVEMEIYKPDKFPIGGLQMAPDRNFTNYNIQLHTGDTLFIFTDGYPDQFGGAKGKKMMTTRFKEFLIHGKDLSMKEQAARIREHFENWKGDHEQVDDVLVIGVRV